MTATKKTELTEAMRFALKTALSSVWLFPGRRLNATYPEVTNPSVCVALESRGLLRRRTNNEGGLAFELTDAGRVLAEVC
jgi:hypothetical protein